MKKFLAITAVTSIVAASIVLFSSLTFAGGPGCDSMKGHGKHEMSAEAWQEFKKNHAWMLSDEHKSMDESAIQREETIKTAPADNSSDLVEI